MRNLLLLIKDLADKDAYKHIGSQTLKRYSETIADIVKYSTSEEILSMFERFGALESIKLSSELVSIVKGADSSKSMKASDPTTWFLSRPEAILNIPVFEIPAADIPYDKALNTVRQDILKERLTGQMQLCFTVGPGTKSWGVAGFYLPEEKSFCFNVPYLKIFAPEGKKAASKYLSAKRFFNYIYKPQTLEVFLHEFRHACDILIMEKQKDAYFDRVSKLAKDYFSVSKTRMKGSKPGSLYFLRDYKDEPIKTAEGNISFFIEQIRKQGSEVLKKLYLEYLFRNSTDASSSKLQIAKEECGNMLDVMLEKAIPRCLGQLTVLSEMSTDLSLGELLDVAYKKRLLAMQASSMSYEALFSEHLIEFSGRLLLVGMLEATKRYNLSAMCESKDDILQDTTNRAMLESFSPSESVTYRLFHILDSLSMNYLGMSFDALSSFTHPSLALLSRGPSGLSFVNTLSNDIWTQELSLVLTNEYSTKLLEDIFQCIADFLPEKDFDGLAEYFSEGMQSTSALSFRFWVQRLVGVLSYDISLKSSGGLLYQILGRYLTKKLVKEKVIPGTQFEENAKFYEYSHELFLNNKLRFTGLLNTENKNLYLISYTLMKTLDGLVLNLPNTVGTLRALQASRSVKDLYYDVLPELRELTRALDCDLKSYRQAILNFIELSGQTNVELKALYNNLELRGILNGIRAGLTKLNRSNPGSQRSGKLGEILKSSGFEARFKEVLTMYGMQLMRVYPGVSAAKYKIPKTIEAAVLHYVGFTADDAAFLVGIYSDILEYFEGLGLMFEFEFVSIASNGLLFGDVDENLSSFLDYLKTVSGLLLMDSRDLGIEGLKLMLLGMSLVEMLVCLEEILLKEYI